MGAIVGDGKVKSQGDFIGIDKRAFYWLPRVGQFTPLEALVSLTISIEDIIHKTGTHPKTADDAVDLLLNHVSVQAFAARWEWSWHKAERFIKQFRKAASERRANGDSVRLIFNDLESTLSTRRRRGGDVTKIKIKREKNTEFHPVLSFYLSRVKEEKGFELELRKADYILLASALKKHGADRVKNILLFHLDSEKWNENPSPSAALSTNSINRYNAKWQSMKFRYSDGAEQPTGEEAWWR